MNNNELIQQAIIYFGKNEHEKGKQLLKQAADNGSPSAVLFYADVLFKQDKLAAYGYLAQQSDAGIVGARHRRALLRRFFDSDDSSHALVEIGNDLIHDADKGDLQSVFALLSLLKSGSVYTYYLCLFSHIAPEIYSLFFSKPEIGWQVEKPSSDVVDQAILSGFNAWSNFETQLLNESVALKVAKNALSEFDCRYMVQRFANQVKPSTIVDPQTGAQMLNPYRTAACVSIIPEYMDWIALSIEYKMALFSGTQRQNGEVMNLIQYLPQQRYLPHFDAIVGDSPNLKAQLANGGQRVCTVLAYLNEVESGGETSFPKLQIKVKPNVGDLLTFRSVDSDGKIIQGSYHAGEAVLQGKKWLLSKWIRQSVTDYGAFFYSR